MKKIILIFATLLSFVVAEAKKYPVIGVNKTNKKEGGGYNDVTWQLGSNQSGTQGWIGECHNPGSISCIPPNGGGIFDNTDMTITAALLGHADVQVENGTPSGTHSQNVQVSGENFLRVYTIIWTTSNGVVTQRVERDDV